MPAGAGASEAVQCKANMMHFRKIAGMVRVLSWRCAAPPQVAESVAEFGGLNPLT
jgi:hypothetical protein